MLTALLLALFLLTGLATFARIAASIRENARGRERHAEAYLANAWHSARWALLIAIAMTLAYQLGW